MIATRGKINQGSGYTILELLIVASILIMLSLLGLDHLHQSREYLYLRFSCQAFTGELARARIIAISSGLPVTIVIDENLKSFRLRFPATATETEFRALPGDLHFVTWPKRSIVFHGSGTCAPAGTFVISSGKASVKIAVSIMGRIRWEFI